MFNSNKTPLVVVAVLLGVSAPLYFARGIGIFDDSLYLKTGQLILDGLKPYRDFYDNKPPGIYYVSAAIAGIGGRGWLAPRIFLFLFAAAFQFVLIRWLQSHFGTRVATIAAILIGLSYPLCQGYSLHTEPFGALAAFAACVLVLSDAPTLRNWAAAGALLGLSIAFKQTGVLYVAAFALFAAFEVRRRRRVTIDLAATLASLVAGLLAVLVPIALVFAAQGLGPAMFDAVFTGAVARASGGLATWRAIVVTWVRGPAFVAFVGVVFLLAASRGAQSVMDERRRRAFVLYALVGVLSMLPTLKTILAGHYLQPGAFAFSAACALFLDAYLGQAAVAARRLVGGAVMTLMAAYFVAVCIGSAEVVRLNKLRSDLALQAQLRQTLDARLDPSEPVICLSINAAARLYLMSGRRPFTRSLYYYPTLNGVFSLDDARRVLLEGRAASALIEIHRDVDRPELNEAELAALRSTYQIIPVGPQTEYRLLALIKHERNEGPRHL